MAKGLDSEQGKKGSTEERIARYLDRINLTKQLPSVRILSLVLVLITALTVLLLPNWDKQPAVWSSGPISNPHKMIEHDCQSCHAEPFQQVQDSACLSCHAVSEHADVMPQLISQGAIADTRCASCHMEHNGDDGMMLRSSQLCAECHAEIGKIHPETETRAVSSFSDHPEFSVKQLRDNAPIKLNHAVHLKKDLRGPDGSTTLECIDCHRFDPSRGIIEPITYQQDCSVCHTLEFDPRLPGRTVPHGDADIVYAFAYSEYAKLFLEDRDGPNVPGFDRFKPGRRTDPGESKTKFTRSEVEQAARETEEQLFTKTACHLCHYVSEREPDGDGSRYEVKQPNIPDRWMPNALFHHGAHQMVKCTSCHTGVLESTETTDLLLPGVKECLACHTDQNQAGKVQSECVLCHSYHEPEHLDEGRKLDLHLFIRGN